MTFSNVGERHREVTFRIMFSRLPGDNNPVTEEEGREALAERSAIIEGASNAGLRAIIRTMEKVLPDFWDFTRKLGYRSPLAYLKAKRRRLRSGKPWHDAWT